MGSHAKELWKISNKMHYYLDLNQSAKVLLREETASWGFYTTLFERSKALQSQLGESPQTALKLLENFIILAFASLTQNYACFITATKNRSWFLNTQAWVYLLGHTCTLIPLHLIKVGLTSKRDKSGLLSTSKIDRYSSETADNYLI